MSDPGKTPDLTVCVLLYGNFPTLASRCLDSLLNAPAGSLAGVDFRIGMNAVGAETRNYVARLQESRPEIAQGLVIDSTENIYKYPMMRRLFGGLNRPVRSELLAWFDDDSFLTSQADVWLKYALETMHTTGAAMLGSRYTIPPAGQQCEYVETQPWYRGKSVRTPGFQFSFCTGGYWVARYKVLQQFNWPIPELRHRGGDVMLGEVLRQNDLTVVHSRTHVAINADARGRESKSPRRGYDETPLGVSYSPSVAEQADVKAPAPDAAPPRSGRTSRLYLDI